MREKWFGVIITAAMMAGSVATTSAAALTAPVVTAATAAETTQPPVKAPEKSAKEAKKMFGPGVTILRSKPGTFGPGVTTTAAPEGVNSLGIAAWRMWALLVVLAGMLAGLFYILRKYGRGVMPGGSAEIMSVKAKIQLDARNSVTVLKIYEEEFVVGAGTEGVRLLARLMPIDGVEAEPPVDDDIAGRQNLEHAAAEIENDFSSRFRTMIDSEEIK